jgi:hypothetical protein
MEVGSRFAVAVTSTSLVKKRLVSVRRGKVVEGLLYEDESSLLETCCASQLSSASFLALVKSGAVL